MNVSSLSVIFCTFFKLILNLMQHISNKGGTVVQWLSLSPHSEKVMSFSTKRKGTIQIVTNSKFKSEHMLWFQEVLVGRYAAGLKRICR